MSLYKYQAVNKDGITVAGQIKAQNEEALTIWLSDNDLKLINYEIQTTNLFNPLQKVKNKDLISICMQLEQMERAKIPITDSIFDIANNASDKVVKDVMHKIHEEIFKNGKMLSEAIESHPKHFDKLFVNLIRIGEKTNSLENIFHDLGEHITWQENIIKKIKKAMYYPIFLLIIMLIVITILFVQVVPKLYDFMNSQGFEIPGYTKALINLAGIFQKHYIFVLTTPIFLTLTWITVIKTSKLGKALFHSTILKIPIVGSTILRIEIARFCRFFGICYKSGMELLEALEIAKDTVNNLKIKHCISLCKATIADGGSISSAFKNATIFPAAVTRMVNIGESSGKLISMLEYINKYYDEEVNETVDKLISMIKPLMMIVLGGLMGWVTISMLGPLYGSISKMNS